MRPTLHSALAFCALFLASPALAIIDDFSTGPGQGAPDQLDDVWQSAFNGWGLSPSGDEDHDGCSNLVECVAGSDPRNPGDCLSVGSMTFAGANVVMSYDAKKGKMYQVWESDNPGGIPPGQPGSLWSEVAGASKLAAADGPDTILFSKPPGTRKFYRLESKDHDSDTDGVSDWAEYQTGTDPNAATSNSNASGGAASDLDTLRSLNSLVVTTSSADAFEKEGASATLRLQRSIGAMPLTVNLAGEAGNTDPAKGGASAGDYTITNMADVPITSLVLPANEGTTTPYDAAKVNPVTDTSTEVPEALKVTVTAAGAPGGQAAMVNIKDANPALAANRTLYVAFLGREAGIVSTASGYATALVDGANNSASVSVFFSNLSSEQNTAYIRIGSDLEVQVLPLGQVSGANWNIRAAQMALTDQAMLNALAAGQLYVAVSTANYPDKEIYGYFNKATGSETFDNTNPNLVAPTLGSALWTTPAGEALEREIWRFMNQATWGGTSALYTEIMTDVNAAIAGGGTYIDGLSAWLDKQMNPLLTPTVKVKDLVMAADMEEFMLRGNKPITYNNDPQINGGTYGVSYVNGMPVTTSTTINTNAGGDNWPGGGNSPSPNRRREWWTVITQSRDQVRQRVAQALHEICVISERDTNTVARYGYGCANYWDMLAAGAFGKYRSILENVTLSPMMGMYLSSMANRALYDANAGTGNPPLWVSPDENYAREVMQLFSIGLVLRHPDGSLQLSGEGLPIATYDNNDITELARVFTGFTHGARHGNATVQVNGGYGAVSNSTQQVSPTVYFNGTTNYIWFTPNSGHQFWQAPWLYPMKVIGRIGAVVYHDFNEKTLLIGKEGETFIPAQTITGMTDSQTHDAAHSEVIAALNCLGGNPASAAYDGHTNTPVNICRWLIQRLITSNPSNGYIYRVQNAYRQSNGLLGPVVKAILLDYEARSLSLADTSISHGKVKEPLVHFAKMLRQFRAYSGASVNVLRDMQLPFSDTDAPMTTGLPAAEVLKFDTANDSPPSLPASWGVDGPFRFRIDSLRNNLGQSPQDAPSVFNWFYPDFIVPGPMAQAGLFAPELQISTEAGEVAKINFLYGYTWMTLAGMSATPGISGANFVLNNGSATPAVRFSTNGGSSYLGWPATIVLDSTNWNTGVTVTMVGVNNSQFSTLTRSTVSYSVTSAAPGYGGVAVPPTTLSIVENEAKNEQLVISQSSGQTWVQEGGMTDTFTVMLSCPPMAGTTVDVALAAVNGEVAVSSSPLAFDSTNWNVPQTVTVSALGAQDDADIEDAGTGNDQIAFTVTSTAANWNGITVPSLAANVSDNDGGYGVVIKQLDSSAAIDGVTNVNETGNNTYGQAGLDRYTIELTKAPTANVVVTITGSQTQVNQTGTSTSFNTPYTRTFTPTAGQAVSGSTSGWNVPQTVVVRGNNDTTNENNHTGTVTHSITTAAGGYPAGLAIQQITASIVDDDNSIIVAHSGSETRVAEGGITDTITVRLRSNPNADVSVVLGSAQLKFTPSQLTFRPTGSPDSLWSDVQVVTVSALDDFLSEGLHTGGILAYSTSSGTNFNGSNGGTALPAAIIDNDDSRLLITQSGGSTIVNEDGTNDTYTLALTRPPATGATVSVSMSGFSGITLSPAGPVVFDESNWNTAVPITVSTTNDGTAEPRATTSITHNLTSTDPVYNKAHSPAVIVYVDDNDPALTVAQTNIFTTVKEGGTAGTGGTPNAKDTFTVVLPRAPASGTTVTVTLNPGPEVTVSPSVLTFTSATSGAGAYNVAQTVEVTAVDDTDLEETPHTGLVTFNIASTDSYYNGAFAPPVQVAVADNDSPGVSIVESGGTTSVTEGSATQDSYTVVLSSVPTGNVDVTVSGGSQILLSKSGTPNLASVTLNFTAANWSTAQTVNVLPVNDTNAELRHLSPITHTVTVASAPEYAALTVPSVTAIIGDNDNTVAANKVRITESSSSTGVTEGGNTVNGVSSNSDTFTVVLSQQPTANVVITFTPNSQLTVSPSQLTFIPGATGTGTFNVAQTVTVRAADDAIVEPILHWGMVTATAASADLFFDGAAITPVTSSVYDNDGPRVFVVPSEGTTIVNENGQTDTYTVSLSSQPAADVTVTISPDAQVTASSAVLTFTSADWSVPRTVTVGGVDDAVAETVSHNGVITHTVASADLLFHNISAAAVTATVWDDDVASVNIAHAGTDPTNTTILEGVSSDQILITLNQPPPAGQTVTITLHPPTYLIPVAQHGKAVGYFNSDQGGSNERDNIVFDYTESILKYRDTFYTKLAQEYGGTIPSPFPNPQTSADNIKLQNAHWAASKAVIDQMDLWFNGGALKARNPVLVEPNQPPPAPLPPFNPRQAIVEAIYRHSGGDNSPATTRYLPQVAYNPQSPPTGTFDTDIRDRIRWAAYLMTVGTPAFCAH